MTLPENTESAPPEDADIALSDLFDRVLTRHKGEITPVGTIVEALEKRGFGVLLILFSLPLCIPIPKPPPIDTILGIPLFYLCLQMILGRATPHLPQKVLKRPISVDFLIRAFDRGHKWLKRFERLFKPRLTSMSERSIDLICGSLGMLMTCSVIVPFPMSNTVPSLCMVVMAMGIMERDRVAAIAFGILGSLWVLGLTLVVIMGGQWILGKL